MATAASLSVSLTLDSSAFKSQVTEAYASAGRASGSFTGKAKRDANELADAMLRTGNAAKALNQVSGSQAFGGMVRGGGQLNYVLHEMAAGSNVASSTIINALLPALDTLKKQLSGGAGGWRDQQQAAREAAAEMKAAAQQQIEIAAAERARATAQAATAERTIAAAAAQRDQAIALDEYYANQAKVNAQYGITVSYEEEHLKNERAILEANRMEAAAEKQLAAARATATAAGKAELTGKEALVVATEAEVAATAELSFAQKAAATGSQLLSSTLGMLGGAPGLALTAIAAGGMAIYSSFKDAEEQTKTLTAAMLDFRTSSANSITSIKDLNEQLGGTKDSAAAVSAALQTGFSGDQLNRVIELALAFQKAGGSASEMVGTITSLNGEPVAALKQLEKRGITISESAVKQALAYDKAGDKVKAMGVIADGVLDAIDSKLKSNGINAKAEAEEVQNLTHWYDSLAEAVAASQGVDVEAMRAREQQRKQEQKTTEEFIAKSRAGWDKAQQERINNTLVVTEYVAKAATAEERIIAQRDSALKALNNSSITDERERAAKRVQIEAKAQADLDKLKKKPRTSNTESTGDRLLDQARKQAAILSAQASQQREQTASEKQIVELNAELASWKGKTLTAEQQSVVNVKDQLLAQLQVNAAAERAALTRKQDLAAEKEISAWARETAALKNQSANTSGQSDEEIEQQEKLEEVRARWANRREQLEKSGRDQASKGYQEELAALQANEDAQVAIVKQAFADKAAARDDYTGGFQSGAKNWMNSAGDAYSQMQTYANDSFDSMTDSLTTFATTGKMNFKSFTKEILSDLSKIGMRIALSNALTSIFGSASGGSAPQDGTGGIPAIPVFNAKGGTYTSASLSAYSNTIVDRPTPFTFAKGAGLMGEAGPEAIMPLTRAADGSLGVRATGGSSTVISVNAPVTIQGGSGSGGSSEVDARATESTSRQLKAIVEATLTERLRRETAPGGLLYGR